MKTKDIKDLVEKYIAAETSVDEERTLSNYFNQHTIDTDLLPYAPLFRQFVDEKQVKAPASAANKLKLAQQRSVKQQRNRIRHISMGIAASLLVIIGIALFQHNRTTNNFVMYSNGKRINNPVAAVEFTNRQLGKISTTLNNVKPIVNKPIRKIEQSLKPLQTTARQLHKVDKMLRFTEPQ